jgi:hypothetical protein
MDTDTTTLPMPAGRSPWRRRRPYLVGGGLVVLLFVAWLVFGYFAVQKLFYDVRVKQAAPVGGRVQATAIFESRAHPTSGVASIVEQADGTKVVRFEQFRTTNGPDVAVYLVPHGGKGNGPHVNLGGLKGNIGDQNYVVPAGTDLAKYDTVLVWCVRFSALFGQAEFAA